MPDTYKKIKPFPLLIVVHSKQSAVDKLYGVCVSAEERTRGHSRTKPMRVGRMQLRILWSRASCVASANKFSALHI